MNIIPTVGVLIIQDNRVLLVKHGVGASHLTGVYGLPAGRINEGESEMQAAKRELEEETGLIAEALMKLPITLEPAAIKRKSGETQYFSWAVYLCKKYSGKIHLGTSETIPEWVDIKNLDQYQLLPNTKYVIEEGIKYV